jgi:Hint domain
VAEPRIAAGAFGPGRPCRDLWLSPDHAVYIGDVLILVECLVNGTSISQAPMDEATYDRVELPWHSVSPTAGCARLVVTGPELDAAKRWVNGLAGRAVPAATAA